MDSPGQRRIDRTSHTCSSVSCIRMDICQMTPTTVPFHSIRIVTVTEPSDERNLGARHRSPPGSSNFAHERLRALGARRADARPKPPPICRNPAPCHGSPGPLSKIETEISVSHVTRPVELSEIVHFCHSTSRCCVLSELNAGRCWLTHQ